MYFVNIRNACSSGDTIEKVKGNLNVEVNVWNLFFWQKVNEKWAKDMEICILNLYSKEYIHIQICVHKCTRKCMQMCIATFFFVTAQITEYPQTIGLWHIHIISYSTTIKISNYSYKQTRIYLNNVMLNEKSQRKECILCNSIYMKFKNRQ